MRRIVIIGPGGAGKSTLARELGVILRLEVLHLDAFHWGPGWNEPPDDEWEATVRKLVARDNWVIDGNYGGTMDIRFEAADTIIFMDMPHWHCLRNVVRRRWTYRGTSRPDMAPGCEEKLDLQFLKWIWNYRRTQRPGILEEIGRYQDGKHVVILRSRRDVRRLLDDVRGRCTFQEAVHR